MAEPSQSTSRVEPFLAHRTLPAPTVLPPRVRVLVMFGGQSAEHDVSRVSAANVLAALDRSRYEVVPIGISTTGRWTHAEEAVELLRGGNLHELGSHGLPVEGTDMDVLATIEASGADIPTVALPILHGPNGEDGTIAGLLELSQVAYVGSGVLGSALSMDKAKAKEVLALHGINQAAFATATEWELSEQWCAEMVDRLGFPIFVKPANMGSSVGVSKARDERELRSAITEALRFDERLVFEEFIDGREIEIGVLGNEHPRCSVAGEIRAGAEFYDYEDKYRDDAAELIIPAELTVAEMAEVERVALAAYRALRCEVLSRVDVFVHPTRGVLLNEINTFPGFTPISMFPRLWAASGLDYSALLDEMIRLALDRHERTSKRRGAQR